jgi:hypothetical protein|tara:strand:- start:631 stop:1173 length:543 start_codon:yes stop_codon:yes gene_type:complete
MAYFATIDENNIVIQVEVVADADTSDENGNIVESVGQNFLHSVHGGVANNYKLTSPLPSSPNLFRKHPAGIGMIYNPINNFFCHSAPTKPNIGGVGSWTLDTDDALWKSPFGIEEPSVNRYDFGTGHVAEPLGISSIWDENAYQADNTKGFLAKCLSELSNIKLEWNNAAESWEPNGTWD